MTKKMIDRKDLSLQDKFVFLLIDNQPNHEYKYGIKGLASHCSNNAFSVSTSIHRLKNKGLIKIFKSHRLTGDGMKVCMGFKPIWFHKEKP